MALVTLFTDASVYPQLGTAGWGAWVKGDERESQMQGGFLHTNSDPREPRFQGSSNMAELAAISEAMTWLDHSGYLTPQDTALLVQSDCLAALQAIKGFIPHTGWSPHRDGVQELGPRKVSSRYEEDALKSINFRMLTFNPRGRISLILRHVKGHRNGPNRQWVNTQCDRIAGEHARRAAEMRV